MNQQELIRKIIAVGRACLNRDMQDSHSGNIAARWVNEEGVPCVAITRNGSQKGELKQGDVCFPSMEETDFGHYRASSETNIHARILSMKGIQASMHAHTKHATVETLGPAGKSGPMAPLELIDPLGRHHLGGSVPVHRFAVPSGSPEMTRIIPGYLENHASVIVQNHGAFAGGRCLEEAFFRVCLVENAGYVVHLARTFGANTAAPRAEAGGDPVDDYDFENLGRIDFEDEPQTVQEFLRTGYRIFEQGLSPFHTGSASIRCVDTMLYTPAASMPHDLPGPLLEVPLAHEEGESFSAGMHRYIYNHSNFQTVIHTFTPEVEAALLYVSPGEEKPPSRIIPIDAEASFLYPSVPILEAGADPQILVEALHDYTLAAVRGGGVWSVGEQSLSEALHHNSSMRDMCLYLLGALRRGLDLRDLEPENAGKW